VALDIINTELPSNRMTKLGPIDIDDVTVAPNIQRRSPEDMSEVSADELENNWFFITAQATITNPLGLWVEGSGETGALVIKCKGTGFYEGPPIGPTAGPGSKKPGACPKPPPKCTWGPEPPPCPGCTPTPTPECPCIPP
jgi:hypothetical protein